MEIIISILFIISIVYSFNILWLVFGFSKVKAVSYFKNASKTSFTIVIPFRNEAENLPRLLHSISLLDYPRYQFEVILVDDASDEPFQLLDYSFPISLINTNRLTNSPKKDAINTAIEKAKYDWIITTDADCVVQEKWLSSFDNCIQKQNPKMIASGVFYKTDGSFLTNFQQLDLLSLQGTTIGSFGNKQAFMCNGANFCYQKSFFYELYGFDGNSSIASGDDVFLLQKAIKKDKNSVCFLKTSTAIVQTQTEKTWKGLFFQRVRWASKTANYKSGYAKQLGLSVFLMNLSWLLIIGFYSIALIDLNWFSLFLASKFIIDFALLYQTSRFFKTQLRYVFTGSLIYPVFSVLVVFYSFLGSYSWKGRRFKK